MTPEKMRALQLEIDDLKGLNANLDSSVQVLKADLATCERALKRRGEDLKAARAKIKTLKG